MRSNKVYAKGPFTKSFDVNMHFKLTCTTNRYYEFITYKSSTENG